MLFLNVWSAAFISMLIIFLLLSNIITSNQSGFAFGDSAINQLVNISNDFGRALTVGKKSELYSVTLVKPLTGYGIKDYCLN
jgi:hypothetical protein